VASFEKSPSLSSQIRLTQLSSLWTRCVIVQDLKSFWSHPGVQESVLPALTKDKKRINGAEIAVEAAWQSTLYVTNFPESLDDAGMKKLFSKVWQVFVEY
jgi:inner membrane protein involved in colicin E2 resistance